ncbi:hypothetical protein [Kitasatospora viridis]|uniref:Uncharacterized protein n=1 Tax=Kitasatospora viridis TaxID=281105 RepID=A0A561UMH2_9ACTN|nr:hypothetical protein [Kitasatospora viridis]TWG00537.1 hypothetical protein FHX73_114416 [Kitasatospora viridis]
MTKRPTATGRLRRGTQDLLERRGMLTAADRPRLVGPFLHTTPQPAKGAGYGGYAALGAEGPFAHGGQRGTEERARTGALPAHAELKGHRHRGAEHHSAH